MRTRVPAVVFAILLSGLLVVAATMPALGYIRQVHTKVLLSAPKVTRCDRSVKITATVINTQTGKRVRGQNVKWKFAGGKVRGDRLSHTQTKSNASGVTSVRVFFGRKAGARKIGASVVVSKPVITVRCAGGLAPTSVVPPPDYVEQPLAAMLASMVEPPDAIASDTALPLASLRVRRLGIDLPMLEGNGYHVPDEAVAHYPGTALPGEGSNTFVYGHAREGSLLELWQVRTGDLVEVDMLHGKSAEYRVSEIHPVVKWDAFEYLEPTDREILTLQTCLSYEDTAPRFVVIAERVPST